jgi:hypothetical protein
LRQLVCDFDGDSGFFLEGSRNSCLLLDLTQLSLLFSYLEAIEPPPQPKL